MNMNVLLSTEERVKILNNIIYKTGPLSVNKVAKDLKLSKGLISKYFDSLLKENILKRSQSKFEIQNNIKTKALKILFNMNIFDTNFFKKHKFVKGAGVYGSFTKGTNTDDSDIDMWILVDETAEENYAKLTRELKELFGDVRPIYLTKEKIEILKKEDITFYYSIVFGSIPIYGDEIEAF